MASEGQSACDIARENTSRVMAKIDSQIPLYVKMQSDMYRRYRQMVDDLLEAGYALERTGLEVPFRSEYARLAASTASRVYSNTLLAQLNVYGEFLKWYVQANRQNMRASEKAFRRFIRSLETKKGGGQVDPSRGKQRKDTTRKARPSRRPRRAAST